MCTGNQYTHTHTITSTTAGSAAGRGGGGAGGTGDGGVGAVKVITLEFGTLHGGRLSVPATPATRPPFHPPCATRIE